MNNKVYFDNNGTTIPPQNVKNKMMKAFDYGNESSHYATKAKKLVDELRRYLYNNLGIGMREYTLIFTSGASESNSTIITTTALSFKNRTGVRPHIITSNIEHKAILKTCQNLVRNGVIECSLLKVDKFGRVNPNDLKDTIKDTTCLVSIMYVNNEIGSINNIEKLGKICHTKKIPFHTDAVQGWGKIRFKPSQQNVDAFSLSFHKIYGPIGLGILGIKTAFIEGYKLSSIIGGMQNGELRGGTTNTPAMAGALTAARWFFNRRTQKIKKLNDMSDELMDKFGTLIPTSYYPASTKSGYSKRGPPLEIVRIGSPGDLAPHTLLLSVVKRVGKPICNLDMRDDLYKAGFIVSIGSACNTTSKKPSHVLYAIDMPKELRCGILRVSVGDTNSMGQVRRFAITLIKCVKKQFTAKEWKEVEAYAPKD